MQKMKVALIGTTGLPAKYGGFETLAHHLTKNLNSRFDFTVYCSSKYFSAKKKRRRSFNGAKLFYLPFNANGYQSIIYDFVSILHALFFADVLLILGVSGAIALPFVKLVSKKPVIINIDGQEWKRPKWNRFTRKYLKFSERIAVNFADTVVTDNKALQDYVKKEYGRDSALIAYGGDHVSYREITVECRKKYSFSDQPYAFSVCRIEPENNIHLILEAFARIPERHLVIVGLWNHGVFGMQLREKYTNYQNIHLLDPIYNQDELNEIRSNASLYIHGHSAGGTNPSLVEAMCLGLPVMAFDAIYNKETTMHRAMYFHTADDLEALVNSTDYEQIEVMGHRLKAIGMKRYSWEAVSNLYTNELEWFTAMATKELTHQLAMREAEEVNIYIEKEHKTEAVKANVQEA